MKRFIILIVAVLAVALVNSQAFAAALGTHPFSFFRLQDDSVKTTSAPRYFTLEGAADADTSKPFTIANAPKTGFSLQYYINDSDTGDFEIVLQENLFSHSSWANAGFADSATAAKEATWISKDSLSVVCASGRKSGIWAPTALTIGSQMRAILREKTNTGTHTVTLGVAVQE